MSPRCAALIVIVSSFVRPIVASKDRLLLQLGWVDFFVVLNHASSLVPQLQHRRRKVVRVAQFLESNQPKIDGTFERKQNEYVVV